MQKRRTTGLREVNGIWHIDKTINGKRFCQSCETSEKHEAEEVLARLIDQQRKSRLFGQRPDRIFRVAATKYLEDYSHKKSIACDANDLIKLDQFIGDLYLRDIHNGTLEQFKKARKKDGVKSGTVNRSLAVLRIILNLCADEWRDEHGLTWLEVAPKVSDVDWKDKRPPRPLSWKEQGILFSTLPNHLQEACLYKINTGSREQEVCQLEWEWEVPIPELKTSVFVLPSWLTKNGCERIVVLNSIAMAVVNRQRGIHPVRVFTYKGRPLAGLNEGAWKRHRKAAGLSDVRIHDLRHTTGRRLRAAGVSKETRSDILGHTTGDQTSHYSIPEIAELIDAVEKIAQESSSSTPILSLFEHGRSRKSHEREKSGSTEVAASNA